MLARTIEAHTRAHASASRSAVNRVRVKAIGLPWSVARGTGNLTTVHAQGCAAGAVGILRRVTIGTSIFVIAVGAILKYAITADISGIDSQTVGVILMLVGILGLILSLLYT